MFVCKNPIVSKRKLILKGIFGAWLSLVLIMVAVCPVYARARSLSAREAAAVPTEISAQSGIVIEATTGSVIYEKQADQRRPMASTTKLMTALVAIDRMSPDTLIEVSPLAVGIEGSSIYLYAGEQLTLSELLYAMLLESANDAAAAIAIAVGGSVEGFADLMNQKASELGLKDTHFTNPHGLDHEDHYTTARELAMIGAEALKNPQLAEILSTKQTTISHGQTAGIRLLVNHNKLLRSYEGCMGMKTGFTKKSGRCLVSSAMRDGVVLIAVTLDAPNDWNDHTAMLDYGFSMYEAVTLCENGDYNQPIWMESGDQSYVIVENRDALVVSLPVDRGQISVTVELPRFEFAPVTAGQEMGQLVYKLQENGQQKIIGTVALYAAYGVAEVDYSLSFWEKIKSFLHIS